MRIDDLFIKRWELSEYIKARNEAEGLDTPEKRFEALGQRMTAAKEAERQRIAFEASTAKTDGKKRGAA